MLLRSLLTMFLRCPQVTDKGAEALAAQIGTNLRNLQHLELDFCE